MTTRGHRRALSARVLLHLRSIEAEGVVMMLTWRSHAVLKLFYITVIELLRVALAARSIIALMALLLLLLAEEHGGACG